jgi:hypothetical protein
MNITVESLINTAESAKIMGHHGKAEILRSIAVQYETKGHITNKQAELVSEFMGLFSTDAVANAIAQRKSIAESWNNRDESFLNWLDFLTCFYVSSRVVPNEGHMAWYKSPAKTLRKALGEHKRNQTITVPLDNIVRAIQRLQKSKLYDKLRACFESTPLYGLGDMVCIRGTSPIFSAWRIIKYGHEKYEDGLYGYQSRKVAESYKIALVTEVLNATFACRQVHKTKGSSRLYKIVAFSGGQQDECWVCESDIKLVK